MALTLVVETWYPTVARVKPTEGCLNEIRTVLCMRSVSTDARAPKVLNDIPVEYRAQKAKPCNVQRIINLSQVIETIFSGK